jgi:hypothetical protein
VNASESYGDAVIGAAKQVDYSFICEENPLLPECEGGEIESEPAVSQKSKGIESEDALDALLSKSEKNKTGDVNGNCCNSSNECVTCGANQNCIRTTDGHSPGPWCAPKDQAACGAERPQFCPIAKKEENESPADDHDNSCCRAQPQEKCAYIFKAGARQFSRCKADKEECKKRGEPWKMCGSDSCCHGDSEECVKPSRGPSFCTKKATMCDIANGEKVCKGKKRRGGLVLGTEIIQCCPKGYTCSEGNIPNCFKPSPTPVAVAGTEQDVGATGTPGPDPTHDPWQFAGATGTPSPDPTHDPNGDPTLSSKPGSNPVPEPTSSFEL